jgi:hypothetical protein
VLYVYDPANEPPLPVEPAPDGLVVIVPSSVADLDHLKTFFIEAARTLGLKPKVTSV